MSQGDPVKSTTTFAVIVALLAGAFRVDRAALAENYEFPQPTQWLCTSADSARIREGGSEIAQSVWHEVATTRRDAAVVNLRTQESLPLSDQQAAWYVGHEWHPGTVGNAYLVRGIFANATGRHRLFLSANGLLIQHSSLGPKDSTAQFSPLVVTLPFAPLRVCNFINTVE